MRHPALLLIFGALQVLTCNRMLGGDHGATPLQATLERDGGEFIEPHFRAYVTAENNQFGFRLAPGYRLSGDPAAGTLTLVNRQGNGSITFAVGGSWTPGGSPNGAAIENSLSNQYPNAEVVGRFERDYSAGRGLGFDLQWKVQDSLVQCKRVVLILSPAGVLEFTAASGRANFPALQVDLDCILTSLQCTTNGAKPKVPPIGDKS